MARAGVHGNWKSILALSSLIVTLGLLAYSVVAHESLGIWLYVFSMATMILGFMSKEDHIAVTGISMIFLVLILDIILRIALLGFTECKDVGFSIWTGC